MEFIQSLLANPFGVALASIGGVLLIWDRLVKVFSMTTKELSRPRNQKVLRAVSRAMKNCMSKAVSPPTIPNDLSFLERMGHWFTAAIYCSFVAWFLLYGVCVLVLGMISLQQNVRALALVVLAMLLFGCAKYFYTHGRYLHSALCNLTDPSTPPRAKRALD